MEQEEKIETKSALTDTVKLLFAKAGSIKKIARKSIKEPYIIAADGQFLGVVSRKKKEKDSIFNEYGMYGSEYSGLSIFNDSGTYGSQDSLYSPFNELTSTPPKLMYKSRSVGFLTKNKQITGCIDPDELFEIVKSQKRINWKSLLKNWEVTVR